MRWEKYYEKLLNEENPRMMFEDGVQNLGVTQSISRREVKKQLKKMKNGRAIGPDGIPVEVWKSLGEEGIDMLWDLTNKIYQREVMPEQWRESFIVPIYKEKGDIQDCAKDLQVVYNQFVPSHRAILTLLNGHDSMHTAVI